MNGSGITTHPYHRHNERSWSVVVPSPGTTSLYHISCVPPSPRNAVDDAEAVGKTGNGSMVCPHWGDGGLVMKWWKSKVCLKFADHAFYRGCINEQHFRTVMVNQDHTMSYEIHPHQSRKKIVEIQIIVGEKRKNTVLRTERKYTSWLLWIRANKLYSFWAKPIPHDSSFESFKHHNTIAFRHIINRSNRPVCVYLCQALTPSRVA